jgi:hypothetical protein
VGANAKAVINPIAIFTRMVCSLLFIYSWCLNRKTLLTLVKS